MGRLKFAPRIKKCIGQNLISESQTLAPADPNSERITPHIFLTVVHQARRGCCWLFPSTCPLHVCHHLLLVVSLIFMLSIVATHPKISAVVRAFLSISLLGKIGSNQWCDRLLEYVNFLQQKRMNAFAAFDTALHNSELIPAMLHVDHAFEEAMHGCGPTEEPMTKSMLREANMLRLFFKGLAGTDLTISEDKNPFWHTGNPVPNVDTERERTPWIHWKRVAYAFSKGVGRETREKWDDFIMSWLRRCCFKM